MCREELHRDSDASMLSQSQSEAATLLQQYQRQQSSCQCRQVWRTPNRLQESKTKSEGERICDGEFERLEIRVRREGGGRGEEVEIVVVVVV